MSFPFKFILTKNTHYDIDLNKRFLSHAGCPADFTYINGKCYKRGTAQTWSEALASCQTNDAGDHLWIIDSQEEFANVVIYFYPARDNEKGKNLLLIYNIYLGFEKCCFFQVTCSKMKCAAYASIEIVFTSVATKFNQTLTMP